MSVVTLHIGPDYSQGAGRCPHFSSAGAGFVISVAFLPLLLIPVLGVWVMRAAGRLP